MALVDRVWPSGLRQYVARPGYDIAFPQAKNEEQTDTGYGLSFVANPSAPFPLACSLDLDGPTTKILFDWWEGDLKFGTLPFLIKNQYRVHTAGAAAVPGGGYSPFDTSIDWWICRWKSSPRGIPFGIKFTWNFELKICR